MSDKLQMNIQELVMEIHKISWPNIFKIRQTIKEIFVFYLLAIIILALLDFGFYYITSLFYK